MIIDATDYELEHTPWISRAACAGMNADLWFPERGGSTSEARTICAHCPVRDECRDYAIRWRIPHGIWGGTSGRERQRLAAGHGRPRRQPPRHGTTSRYHIGCRCDRCIEAQMAYIEEHRP